MDLEVQRERRYVILTYTGMSLETKRNYCLLGIKRNSRIDRSPWSPGSTGRSGNDQSLNQLQVNLMCTALQIDEETLEKYFKPVKGLQTEVGVMCVLYNMWNDQLYTIPIRHHR